MQATMPEYCFPNLGVTRSNRVGITNKINYLNYYNLYFIVAMHCDQIPCISGFFPPLTATPRDIVRNMKPRVGIDRSRPFRQS